MKSRITKFAAAAVIIVGVLLGIHTFAGGGVSRALADVIENTKKMPWLHIVMDVRPVGTHGEYWFCFDSLIEIHNEKDAISYIDFGKREKQVYDRQANTITVSYLARGNFLHDAPGAESPWTFLERLIEKMKTEGGRVSRLRGEYQGSAADIYEVTLPRRAHKGPTVIKIIANPDTNLPIAYHQETPYRHPDKEEVLAIKTCELSFDFPEKGPQNLYELGVPELAEVVNNLPNLNAIKILDSYKARRDAFFKQRFLAVVGISRGPDKMFSGAHVIYNDQSVLRIDYYRIEKRFNPGGNWPGSKNELGSTAGSVLQWLRMSGFATLRQTQLFDGKHHFRSTLIRKNSQEWQWSSDNNPGRSKWNHDIMGNCLPLLERWLSKSISVTIIEDDYSKDQALTCIQLLGPNSEYGLLSPHKCLIYLDAQNDYHWRRLELEYRSRAEPADSTRISIREVKEFSQTEEGWVYPRVSQEWEGESDPVSPSMIRTVYLEMNLAFPEGIFLAENLPQ